MKTVAFLIFPLWLTILGIAGIVFWLAGSWKFSNLIRRKVLEPKATSTSKFLKVLEIGTDVLTLGVIQKMDSSHRWNQEGLWGLRWPEGYAQVGKIIQLGKNRVSRRLYPLKGHLVTGTKVTLHGLAFPDEPEQAFGLSTCRVQYTSPLGRFPAWLIPSHQTTWMILVHGKRGAPPEYSLKSSPLLRVSTSLGLPSFIISYRNDLEAPASPDGYHWYGLTEWQDLEGAATHALESGSTGLVLAGYSMGGAVVMSFLQRSSLATAVRGVILDSPVLDLEATVDFAARNRSLSWLFSRTGKNLAELRFGIHWEDLNYLAKIETLRTPTLVVHGESDTLVPVETSKRLARTRPDLVRCLTFPEANHGNAWNLDPHRYECAAREFLENVLSETIPFQSEGRSDDYP